MSPKVNEECCSIESVVTIDERGQMVLPKSIRDAMDIGPGDKLAVVAVRRAGKACCVTLIKADAFAGTVKVVLRSVVGDEGEREETMKGKSRRTRTAKRRGRSRPGGRK